MVHPVIKIYCILSAQDLFTLLLIRAPNVEWKRPLCITLIHVTRWADTTLVLKKTCYQSLISFLVCFCFCFPDHSGPACEPNQANEIKLLGLQLQL